MDLKYNLSLAVDAPARRGVATGIATGVATGVATGGTSTAGDDIRAVIERLTAVAVRAELVRWFGEVAVAATFTGLAATPVPATADTAADAAAADAADAVFIERAEGAPAVALSAAAIGARGVAGPAAPRQAAQAPDVIIVSGCADSQTSADASFNHRANGALTYYVLAVLRRSISGGAWPAAPDFLLELRRRLRAGGYDQIPQISSESPVGKATLFSLV
jgi:hypothetical protein